MDFKDEDVLAFVNNQANLVSEKVYEAPMSSWDFSQLAFVDTSAPEWAPGVLTFSSNLSGSASWQSGYAKDIPNANVSTKSSTRSIELAAIGYEWTLEEVNAIMGWPGANLTDRRAFAAHTAYRKFMYDLVLLGDASKGFDGLVNYTGVAKSDAPADGGVGNNQSEWVTNAGVAVKTPAQIVRDMSQVLSMVNTASQGGIMADTILMPIKCFEHISGTPYGISQETILSFFLRTNLYTAVTGQPLTIKAVQGLEKADSGTHGRLVAYANNQDNAVIHLPMPHRFLDPFRVSPMIWQVGGIFRTGGLELINTSSAAYLDKVMAP